MGPRGSGSLALDCASGLGEGSAMRVVAVASFQERSALKQAAGLPPFDARQIEGHVADAHLCAIGSEGEIRAYGSLWWGQAPQLPDRKTGVIGHYASMDNEAAAALFDEAVARLQEQGCASAVGPMNGNTWRHYRFVTDSDPEKVVEPPFFLEPANPPEWPRQWEQAGFEKLAEYYSALNSDLARPD
jgi:hypothetical protein